MSEIIKELDWDGEISAESNFELLPEGDYDFTVSKIERSRYTGDKMPHCNQITATLTIWGPENSVDIIEKFPLNTKMEWKVSSLYLALGLKKHGEPTKMNWAAVTGLKGKCRLYIDNYPKKDGSGTAQANKIKKYYDYGDDIKTVSPQPASTSAPNSGYQAGVF